MSTATSDLRPKLDEVNEQLADKRTESAKAYEVFDQAREQFKQAGHDANRTESEEFKKMNELHLPFAKCEEEIKDLEAVRDGIFRMLHGGPQQSQAPPAQSPDEKREAKSLADRIIGSDEYQALKKSGVLDSERLSFNEKLGETARAELKALITGASDTSGGAFVQNDIQPYVSQPRRMLRVSDLITTGQTDSDTVEYARQTTFTNVAAETAEATATDTGTKPEATIAFEKVTAAVKTIAHWLPATRRSLADAGQLRTLVESQLLYGLALRLDGQIVNGAGTGETLTGIINTSGIATQALGTDSVADAIHKAITQIRLADLEPNGVAMHPNDWQLLRLARDGSGSVAGSGGYLWGPPSQVGPQQVWGLDVAVSASIPDDTSLVGDFTKAVLWLREGAQVLASDSHSDFFVKNLIALLAEMRAALGVLLPAAFCKVTSVD